MKLGWKIFLLCMSIYVISLIATGVVVTENSHRSLLRNEIDRNLEEEESLRSTLALYLLSRQRLTEEPLDKTLYSQNMVDMVEGDGNHLHIFDEQLNLLASNAPDHLEVKRQSLEAAREGHRNFVLSSMEDASYVHVSSYLPAGNETMVFSLSRDVTHLDVQRRNQYLFFLYIGLTGLVFVALISWILSRKLVNPFRELNKIADDIATGNYDVRANIERNDEVGQLAKRFNQMAEQVEENMEALKEETQRQQRFVDNVTHELRTPLTSIIGYADFLMKAEYEPEVFQKGLRYIHGEGNRMLMITKALMNMILMREQMTSIQIHSAQNVLEEVHVIMKDQAETNRVHIILDAVDANVALDRDLFKVVMTNLIDNAIKASSAHQTVRFGCRPVENGVEFFIQDQGQGIDQTSIPRLTEPFYRVDQARSRKEGGMGLGMAICQQILAAHGVEMNIDSQVGEGTTIKMTFPSGIYKNVTKSN